MLPRFSCFPAPLLSLLLLAAIPTASATIYAERGFGEKDGNGSIASDLNPAGLVAGIIMEEEGRRRAVTYQQAAAKLTQLRIQFGQGGVDKAHAAVVARERGEDIGIEYEDAPDAAAILHGVAQRMVQSSVVEDTQVAAKPDKRLAFRNHRVFSQQGRPFYGLGSIRCATCSLLAARTRALGMAGRAFQCKLSKSLMLLSG